MKFTAIILSVVSAVAFSSCCCQTQSAPKLRKVPADLVPAEQPGQPATPAAQPGDQVNGPVKVLDGVSK
ncbi:MAG: hypothetical protein IKK73_06115 [Akkermansia sp.]|nr:hypothetical protein [Akkermansia sp.]